MRYWNITCHIGPLLLYVDVEPYRKITCHLGFFLVYRSFELYMSITCHSMTSVMENYTKYEQKYCCGKIHVDTSSPTNSNILLDTSAIHIRQ